MTPEAGRARLPSIDIVRGGVMVLMALDHVRVYAGIPAGGPSPAIFFTRWVTHFVAPAFVFLAGTSAFLYGRTRTNLRHFLLTRGCWLVLLELTVIRWGWTFNLAWHDYTLAGVIWVLGWSMILLALLVRLPVWAVAGVGAVLVAGHNALPWQAIVDAAGSSPFGWLWKIGYVGFFAGPVDVPGVTRLFVLYSIVPWIGVMALGYAFGQIMTFEVDRRRRVGLYLGVGAIVLFLVLRGSNLYGDPSPWRRPDSPDGLPVLLSFLNTAKYPASLSFLLMTLGPMLVLLSLLEGARGRVAQWLETLGRVPFFYYLAHLVLIHAVALLVSQLWTGGVSPWLFANHPMDAPPPPDGYRWSLSLLYAIWAGVVVLLYFPCRWFAAVKARRAGGWLRYV